jgi:Arc/MetJ-type ribon-helix-helix transcriptional regulator
MSNELSPDTESFIAGEVAMGAYPSRQDALEAGVALLKKRRELLEKLDEGQRQLDNGEYVDFDEEGLRQFFEGLKERARSGRAKA